MKNAGGIETAEKTFDTRESGSDKGCFEIFRNSTKYTIQYFDLVYVVRGKFL